MKRSPLFLLLFIISSFVSFVSAQGLLVSPTRVVFENRTRSAGITLVNRSTEAETYRIQFIQMRMQSDGQIKIIEQAGPGDKFSDKLVRYAPRQVTLEPGKAQIIRLMLRKPADLPPGEYRSHLTFRMVPTGLGTDVENLDNDKEEVGVRMVPRFGIAVPIIVRNGGTEASLTVNDLHLQAAASNDTDPALTFNLARGGDYSAYGDLAAVHMGDDGKKSILGLVKGLAVYAPNAHRAFRFPLKVPDHLSLDSGRIILSYTNHPEKDGARSVYGEIQLR